MSRQESQIIKGIALLMMLWLHLFTDTQSTLHLDNLIVINNMPLANLLARACPPVGFFVFCGGYGLYYTYRKGKDKHYLSRIAKLFIVYWLVLLVCIPLCIYVTIVILKILLNSAADGGFYTLGFILMVLVLPLNPTGCTAKFFETIGIHSMNMWMIHYMLYTYIIHDQIWGLHYPTLIFIVLLLLSYLSSILMNATLKPIYKVLNLS